MKKKMYSFRLSEDLVNRAKEVAKEMDISLSLLLTHSVKEKLDSLKNEDKSSNFFVTRKDSREGLDTIAEEIKQLRLDLNRILKSSK